MWGFNKGTLRRLAAVLAVILVLGLVAGCSSSKGRESAPGSYGPMQDAAKTSPSVGAPAAGGTRAGGSPATDSSRNSEAKPAGTPQSSVLGTPVAPARRKIIQNADLSFEVINLSDALVKVDQAVAAGGGYTAESNLAGTDSDNPRAHLVLRLPFSGFNEFLARLEDLGEMTGRRIFTDDVTAEYLDLEARIATTREHEARLRQILAQAQDLDDLLRLEQELSRVRGEVESMTGRLNFLKDQVEMSTVTLDLVQQPKAAAPQAEPGVWQQVRQSFMEMTRSLWDFSKALLVTAAAALPLLLYVLLLGFIAWKVVAFMRPWFNRLRPPAPPGPSA